MENNDNRPHCRDCKYFAGMKATLANLKGPGGGLCLRFPPTPMITGFGPNQQPIMGGQCPPVAETHMCGEFSPAQPTYGAPQ